MRIVQKSLQSEWATCTRSTNLANSSFVKKIAPVGSISSCKVLFQDADAACIGTYVLASARGYELAAIHEFHLKLAPLVLVVGLVLALEHHLHSPRIHCSEDFQGSRFSQNFGYTLDVLEC